MNRYILLLITAVLLSASLNAQCWGIYDNAPDSDTTETIDLSTGSVPMPHFIGTSEMPICMVTAPYIAVVSSTEKPFAWYDFSTYKFKGGGKRAVWIAYFAAGVLHGGREAYHAEPTVFEKRFNAAPLSFFGSEQWKRQYYNRDPENGHKPNIWNPIRDYYHFSGAATKAIWIGGAFTIGMSKQPMKYKLIDLLIGALITSGSASLTYNILR